VLFLPSTMVKRAYLRYIRTNNAFRLAESDSLIRYAFTFMDEADFVKTKLIKVSLWLNCALHNWLSPIRVGRGLCHLCAIQAHRLHQFFALQIEINQAKQGLQLRNVFSQTTILCFSVTKLTFQYSDHVPHCGSRASNQPVGLLFMLIQHSSRLGFDRGQQDGVVLRPGFSFLFAAIGVFVEYAVFFAV